jgi:hypothetical protein
MIGGQPTRKKVEDMEKTTGGFPPLSPREYIAFLCSRFGKPYVTRKFGVTDRTIERWMADERYVGEEGTRKGPFEKYEETLQDCMDRGHAMEARAMVARQAKVVECELVECDPIMTLGDDWREQLLEDLQAFSRFQEAVQLFVEEELNDRELSHQYDILVRELRRTVNCVKRRLGGEMRTMREQQRPYGLWQRKAPRGVHRDRDMAQMRGMRSPVDLREEDLCPGCGADVREEVRRCPRCGFCFGCI